MALLHAAHVWSGLSGVPIEAVTVNHGLRAEAAQEAELVAQVCGGWAVPHTILQWDGTKAKGNSAAAGRDARYNLIAKWAKARKIQGVLVGHTQDDIAETFLMRLARKSGVDGLSLMDIQFERNGISWSRPFWQQKRADLRDYLGRHSVPWVDDPTNEDQTHERPKARKALAVLAPLGITSDVLKSVALHMSGAQSALQHYAVQEAKRVVTLEGGDVVINRRVNPPVPADIHRRLLVAALQYVGGSVYPPRAQAVQDLEISMMSSGTHTLAGCLVIGDKMTLRITRELQACRKHEVPVGSVWDGRWAIEGPDSGGLTIRALAAHLSEAPDWRETGLRRETLMATPAVFDGETLISAPVAGLQNGFEARIVAEFTSFLL